MKRRTIIIVILTAAALSARASFQDDPATPDASTNTLAQSGALLGPKVTPAAGATEVRDPAPPAPLTPGSTSKAPASKPESKADLGKYRAIVERAPFRSALLPQAQPGGTAISQQLRLNGIIRIGDQISAGIEDTAQKKSLILAVGRTEDGIEIQSIDEQAQTVSLLYNGQPMTLALEKTPGVSGAPMAMPVMPGSSPMSGGIQPPAQPAPGNPPAPGTAQKPAVKRKRIIIPREK